MRFANYRQQKKPFKPVQRIKEDISSHLTQIILWLLRVNNTCFTDTQKCSNTNSGRNLFESTYFTVLH